MARSSVARLTLVIAVFVMTLILGRAEAVR